MLRCINYKHNSKVSEDANIRNRYNQVPHLNQDTKWESDKLTEGTTNESQEVSPFPAGDHNAHKNRWSRQVHLVPHPPEYQRKIILPILLILN